MSATFVYVANAVSRSISIFSLDRASGKLRDIAIVDAGGVVMPLVVSPDRRFLYASIRSQPFSIASYAIDAATGRLEPLSVVPAPDSLVSIAVDASGRFLLGASYGGGSICVLPIGRDGFVQAEPAALLHPGRNPHSIHADPSNRFVFVPCLGSDHISQFRLEPDGGLVPNQPAILPTGHLSGPRHLCFSPNNRFAYLLTELSGEVLCFALDAKAGTLAEKQRLSIMPPGSTIRPGTYVPPTNAKVPGEEARISAADIQRTPDGRFVYACERTASIIAGFAADPVAGTLTSIGISETEEQPRGFAICPRGRYLIAAGEKSHHVSVYAIQPDGALRRICRHPAGESPNWLAIVDV